MTTRSIASLATAIFAALLVSPLARAGEPVKVVVTTCAGCHGAEGHGSMGQGAEAAPRLAGLPADYLARQLQAYASGTRDNAVMQPIAAALDSTARAEVSAFYAALAPPPVVAGGKSEPAGETLALRGDWAKQVPPCASCHGRRGLGVGAAFPPLAGQPAEYLAAQLQAWKAGSRRDDPQGLMRSVAARLDQAQIAAVSAYYAMLPTMPAQSGPVR